MMKILAISGSLRTSSSNTAILHAVIGLTPDGMNISIYNGLATFHTSILKLTGITHLLQSEIGALGLRSLMAYSCAPPNMHMVYQVF
jgi:hypothetical protein